MPKRENLQRIDNYTKSQIAGVATYAAAPGVGAGSGITQATFDAHVADVNAHHAKQHTLATTFGLGADHIVSGLTSGQVLRATGADTAGFAHLAHTELANVLPDQHHAQAHNMVGADHTYTGGNALDLFGLTGPSAIGLIAPSSNPGAAERVLKTNGSGNLALASITVPYLDTSSGNMNIVPAGDLYLNPAGGDVFVPSNRAIGTNVHVAGLLGSGWRISERSGIAGLSHLDIRSIYADELFVTHFTADIVRVRIGQDFLTPSSGIMTLDNLDNKFVIPAIDASARFYVEDSPDFAGPLFADNEWVLIELIDRSGGGFIKSWNWGQVSGYQVELENRQSWLFTLKQGLPGLEIGPGSQVISFGLSGSGYIHRSVVDPGSPWTRYSTWSGANPYTPANRTVWVQIGGLDEIVDTDLNPEGWGLYSTNAYLKGSLSAGNGKVVIDALGAKLNLAGDLTWSVTSPGAHNIDITPTQVYGVKDGNTLYGGIGGGKGSTTDSVIVYNQQYYDTFTGGKHSHVIIDSRYIDDVTDSLGGDPGQKTAKITLATSRWFPGSGNVTVSRMTVESNAGGQDSVNFFTDNVNVNARLRPLSGVDGFTAYGNIVPDQDLSKNLGSAVLRWNVVYANQLVVAGTISGAIMSGQEWEYTGSMTIDANNAANTVVSIVNQGAGRADLNVDRDIIVGGLVDGVDVAILSTNFTALQSAYTGHIGNADAHHARSHVLATGAGLGSDHSVSGLTTGHALRATGSTTAAFQQMQHSDLGGVTANQHHNQSHVLATTSALGPDHTVSGLTAGFVLRANTATGARFERLSHDDLSGVTQDQHHARSHAMLSTSDHTYSGGAALDLFGLTAPSTPGLITPSSAPGAATRVLKSDTNGNLILQGITANVDATVGQSLYTGGSNLRVIYHSTPSPHVHMAINPTVSWALDEQFGVDIDDNLLVRGWIVGKHAIQLPGAQMICHYDGPEPYLTNTKGEPTGHMGQVGTGAPIFRPGKFGKGVQIAEATTNLIVNPSFEVDATGWSNYSTGSAAGSRTRVTNRSMYGPTSYKLVKSGGSNGDNYGISISVPVTVGQTYSFSTWIYVEALAGTTPQFGISVQGNVTTQTGYVSAVTTDWVRISVTTTSTGTGNTTLFLFFENGTGTVYIDAVQAENKSYLTPYSDGSLGDGHAWTGVAHASTSTRSAGTLYYAGSNINLQTGSILLWANFDNRKSGDQCLFGIGNSGTNRFYVSWFSSSSLYANYQSDITTHVITNATPPNSGWHHVAVTWSSTTLSFYVDGQLNGTTAMPSAIISGATNLYVGGYYDGSLSWNGVIDEFVLCDREVTIDEVRAIYESNAPVFGETSTFQWRAAQNLVWADSEGLWMVDTSGNAVLGASGVNSKGWGGLTLDQGDFLLGSTTKGYLLFDAGTQDLALKMATAGSVFLTISPTTGIDLEANTASTNDERAIAWKSGGATVSYLKGYADATINYLYMETTALFTGRDANVLVAANSDSSRTSLIQLQAYNSLNTSQMTLAANNSDPYIRASVARFEVTGKASIGRTTPSGQLDVWQSGSSAALPVLRLQQSDDSEEFFEFVGSIGAGSPIDTAALGSFYGKIRVSVSGVGMKYIALYNS